MNISDGMLWIALLGWLLLVAALIHMRSQGRRIRELLEASSPQVGLATDNGQGLAAPEVPNSSAKAVELRGRLSLFQVPALLEMVATCEKPSTLIIRRDLDEKRIHFRNGRVAAATAVNRRGGATSGFLMNKLGALLVRMKLVSELQRDQALAVCETSPHRRLGEVLVEMGALSPEDLRKALRAQAESVIFSLFLFPEGSFELIYENHAVAPEDDLDLSIGELLNEAAHQQQEWDQLRQAIPALDVILDIDAQGQEKLRQANLSDHQQSVLALVDGQRSLRDICRETTMLDYEVFKFLFLMTRAHILRVVARGTRV